MQPLCKVGNLGDQDRRDYAALIIFQITGFKSPEQSSQMEMEKWLLELC